MSMEVAARRYSAGDGTGIPLQVVSTGNSASSMGGSVVSTATCDVSYPEELARSGLNIECTGGYVAKCGLTNWDSRVLTSICSEKSLQREVFAAYLFEALALFPIERGSAAEREVLKRQFTAFCAEKVCGIPVHAIY